MTARSYEPEAFCFCSVEQALDQIAMKWSRPAIPFDRMNLSRFIEGERSHATNWKHAVLPIDHDSL